jgi:hypothetical protein
VHRTLRPRITGEIMVSATNCLLTIPPGGTLCGFCREDGAGSGYQVTHLQGNNQSIWFAHKELFVDYHYHVFPFILSYRDEVTKVLSDLLVCFAILEDLAAIQVLHHSSIFMPILFLCVHRWLKILWCRLIPFFLLTLVRWDVVMILANFCL